MIGRGLPETAGVAPVVYFRTTRVWRPYRATLDFLETTEVLAADLMTYTLTVTNLYTIQTTP